ncbi:MAG: protein phosphatase CheZ [Alphaproteobacteria bacterium]
MAKPKAVSVRQLVGQVRKGNANDVPLFDLVRMVEHLVEDLDRSDDSPSAKSARKSLSDQIQAEFAAIASSIAQARKDLSEFKPGDVNSQHIPAAGRELQAIVEATENATHMIMEAAENLLELETTDIDKHKEAVANEAMKIFEACSFQDITGQRVSKIVETLEYIDQRVDRITKKLGLEQGPPASAQEETTREKRKRELILNGPAMEGEGVAQDDIDAMFN